MAPSFGRSDRTAPRGGLIGRGRYRGPCLECRRPYEALTTKSRYCSGACRAAYSRYQRDAAVRFPLERTLREAEERVTALLVYLDEALKP